MIDGILKSYQMSTRQNKQNVKRSLSFSSPIATSSPERGWVQYLQDIANKVIQYEKSNVDNILYELEKCTLVQKLLYSSEAVYYTVPSENEKESEKYSEISNKENIGSIKSSQKNDRKNVDNEDIRKKSIVKKRVGKSLHTKYQQSATGQPQILTSKKGNSTIKSNKQKMTTQQKKQHHQLLKAELSASMRKALETMDNNNWSVDDGNKVKMKRLVSATSCSSSKRNSYQVAVVTPKPNIKGPRSILRKPKPGELAISVTGSPLMVAQLNGPTNVSHVTIPLADGRIMEVLGQDGLNVEDIPHLDKKTISQLEKLHQFLGEAIKQ